MKLKLKGWAPKNWCLWTVVLEKVPESRLNSKIKSVTLKGKQPWILIGRTDTEAEAPILWPPDVKSQLIGKDSDLGEDWGQENGITQYEMVGWHHWHNGHGWSCLNSGRYWRTGKPGMLQFMGSQRVGPDWATGQQQMLVSQNDLKVFLPLQFLGIVWNTNYS